MSNLIYANFKRVWKSTAFKVTEIVVCIIALFEIVVGALDKVVNDGVPTDYNAIFGIAEIIVFVVAGLIAAYIGTEFSDGTIRNKLVTGHSRVKIYLSGLFVTLIYVVIIIATWSVIWFAAGSLIIGKGFMLLDGMSIFEVYVPFYLVTLAESAAFAAIYIFIAMVVCNKTASTIINYAGAVVVLVASVIVISMLEEPDYYTDVVVADNGSIEYVGEPIPNPSYLPEGSEKRKVYEMLVEVTPGCQALLACDAFAEKPLKIWMYDLGWIILVTGAGILIFEKKDLR